MVRKIWINCYNLLIIPILGPLCRAQGKRPIHCAIQVSMVFMIFLSVLHGHRYLLRRLFYYCDCHAYVCCSCSKKATVCTHLPFYHQRRLGIVCFDWCGPPFCSPSVPLTAFATAAIPFGIRSSYGSVYGPDEFVCGIRSVFPKLLFFFHLLPVCVFVIFVIHIFDHGHL